MTNTKTFISAIGITLVAACSGGGEQVGIEVRASTSDGDTGPSSLELVDDGGATYEISSSRVFLRHIELDLPDGASCADIEDQLVGAECDDSPDDSDKIRIPGPFDVDLVTGVSTPSLADVSIPAGTYQRIDFRVEDDANDVSFAVTAAFEHEGEALTLELELDFNEDIRIEQPGGVEVTADSDLIAEFVVSNWFGGVDIGSCIEEAEVEMDGSTVHIREGSTSGACSAIEDTIKKNMKESGQLDRD